MLRDVAIDSFPAFTEQCANTRSRTSDESFDEFCGLLFDTFSVQSCLRVEMRFFFFFSSQQVDPVVTILKFTLLMDGMNPHLRRLLS